MNVVLIIPANLLTKANALGAAMGWGPDSYSIPLSVSGSAPATHWGLNLANAGEEFLSMLLGASQGQVPEELVDVGFPMSDFGAVLSGLLTGLGKTFPETLQGLGLKNVEVSS